MSLKPEVRRQLYLILKEALTNAARHSGASTVSVTIDRGDGGILGRVSDDGGGFDPETVGGRNDRLGGNGLVNMRARAEKVGGRLLVESSPGQGTSLSVRVPLD